MRQARLRQHTATGDRLNLTEDLPCDKLTQVNVAAHRRKNALVATLMVYLLALVAAWTAAEAAADCSCACACPDTAAASQSRTADAAERPNCCAETDDESRVVAAGVLDAPSASFSVLSGTETRPGQPPAKRFTPVEKRGPPPRRQPKYIAYQTLLL